jgi:hypothetical protein
VVNVVTNIIPGLKGLSRKSYCNEIKYNFLAKSSELFIKCTVISVPKCVDRLFSWLLVLGQ